MAHIVQRPLCLLVAIGSMATTRTGLPCVVSTAADDLWLWQMSNRRHPFGGIRPILARTERRFAPFARMFGPAIYDAMPLEFIRTPVALL